MMRANVLNKEVRVKHFGIGYGSANLMYDATSMDQFMPDHRIQSPALSAAYRVNDKFEVGNSESSSADAPQHVEKHHYIKDEGCIKGNQESSIFFHHSNSGFRQVMMVHWEDVVEEWEEHIGNPNYHEKVPLEFKCQAHNNHNYRRKIGENLPPSHWLDSLFLRKFSLGSCRIDFYGIRRFFYNRSH
jgi:hypothetical protein